MQEPALHIRRECQWSDYTNGPSVMLSMEPSTQRCIATTGDKRYTVVVCIPSITAGAYRTTPNQRLLDTWRHQIDPVCHAVVVLPHARYEIEYSTFTGEISALKEYCTESELVEIAHLRLPLRHPFTQMLLLVDELST